MVTTAAFRNLERHAQATVSLVQLLLKKLLWQVAVSRQDNVALDLSYCGVFRGDLKARNTGEGLPITLMQGSASHIDTVGGYVP